VFERCLYWGATVMAIQSTVSSVRCIQKLYIFRLLQCFTSPPSRPPSRPPSLPAPRIQPQDRESFSVSEFRTWNRGELEWRKISPSRCAIQSNYLMIRIQ
jgi:hypothetical protein